MINPSEMPPTRKQETNELFEILYKKVLVSNGGFLEYNAPYPKVDFLEYLTKKKNLLVHGSNHDVASLEPRQANCKSKKFGNLTAVYATADTVVPIFYAIKDKERFHGMAISGFTESTLDDGAEGTTYKFEVEPKMLESAP